MFKMEPSKNTDLEGAQEMTDRVNDGNNLAVELQSNENPASKSPNEATKTSPLTTLLSKPRVEPINFETEGDTNAEMPEGTDSGDPEPVRPLARHQLFGWLNFRPNWLQKLNHPVPMLIFICLLVAVQAKLVSGFLNTSLSTIEKVFGLSSTESGLIISTYDVASLLAVIPVTYFGQAGRKPRYLGGGAMLIAIGCFVFFLPEAFRDPYTWLSDEELQYCSNSGKVQECAKHKSNHKLRFIFMVGTLLIGIGATPVYTLGVAYMDENVPKAKSALYLGIFYTIAVVAPALGYVLSGLFLRIPIDFKHWKVDVTDPGWAGAWFIGFLLQALLAFLISIPLLGLPKRLKGAEDIPRVDESVTSKEKEKKSMGFKDLKQALKTLPLSLLVLLKNSTFMLLIMHGVCAYLVISGLSTFLPKYFESQYGLSSSDSAFMVGSLAIPGAAIGTLGSGIFLKHKDWPCKNVMKFGLAVQVITIPLLSFFLFSCPRYDLAGLDVNYINFTERSEDVSFDSNCNSLCFCDYVFFDPVCASNGVTYFSPCHAGCYDEKLDNCKCLKVASGEYHKATREICSENCPFRVLLYVLFFLTLLVASMVSVPHITCLLRVVPESQRSLALGLQWVFVRLLGTIPGPIIVGKIFDSTCLLWNKSEACHSSGFCLNHDNGKLSLFVFIYSVTPLCVGCVLLVIAVRTYQPPSSSLVVESLTSEKPSNGVPVPLDTNAEDTPYTR